MKKENQLTYTTIIHSIRNDLGLTNNEYIFCDTIYHLSNNPEYNYCIMSKEKLGEILGVSKQAIHKLISKMIEFGLIEKEDSLKGLKTTEKWYNNVILREQSTKFTDSKESLPSQSTKFTPMVKKVYSDSKESLPYIYNNNNINNNTNNKSEIKISSSSFNENDKKLTNYLYKKVKERYSFTKDKTEKQLVKDYEEMNKIHRLDGFDYKIMLNVLKFSQTDDFWKQNIRSIKKFREKFETLLIQEESKSKKLKGKEVLDLSM